MTRSLKIILENFTKKGVEFGIREKFIPDPGGKKSTEPGSGSATLHQDIVKLGTP
jgi:hypothetical protein